MLRLPIPLPSTYPARVWFLDGGSFTLGKLGAEKVRGQSVDISKEEAPQISVYGASSCLETWCRRSDSRPDIPFCRFVSGSVPLSIPNTVPIVPVAPYRHV